MIKELDRSIERFYEGLTQNVINQFKAMIEDANIIRNYITFNYTMSLEAFLSIKAKYQRVVEATPIHIHGKLDEDVVLGIDNTEQLSDIAFSLTRKGRRAFIKTIFNEQYDKARVNAAKKIISESDTRIRLRTKMVSFPKVLLPLPLTSGCSTRIPFAKCFIF